MTPTTPESNTQPQDTQDAAGLFSKIDQRPSGAAAAQLHAPDAGGLDHKVLPALFETPHDASKAWLCAFTETARPNWTGAERKNWHAGGLKAMERQNAYVCNGTYRDGTKRSKSNVEKIHFYVLDDIGSKVGYSHARGVLAKGGVIPALEIETSPGNETWLIAAKGIDTQQSFDRYTALQRAMGRAGLTDPAMKDTTRYVRLPFGINDKTKYLDAKGKAPSVRPLLIAPSTTKRWEIDELAKALGIDLDAEIASETLVASGHAGGTLLKNGLDPYVSALGELGLVLSQKPNGWIEIECPWEHEHTTRGLTGTAYLPGGGWECHHGHCAGRSTEDFKAELRRRLDAKGVKGGSSGFLASAAFDDPDADVGLADAVRALADKLGVLEDGDALTSSEPGQSFLDRVAYVKNSDRFFEIGSGTFMNRNALDTVWTRPLIGVLKRNKQGELAERPSQFFTRAAGTKVADVPIYWPGKPTLFEHDKQVRLNVWRAPERRRRGRKIGSHEIKLWLKLVLDLTNGDRREARVLLDMLALIVFEQDWKPGFAIILKGTQGIGKDLVLSVLSRALGHTNFSVITPDRIGTRFNVDTEKRAIVVNEMKMTTRGSLTAHDQYNALKTLVAPLPEWVRVERKGIDAYMIPNRAAWFFTTNEDAPIAMDEADRRFFVIECKRTARRDSAFYENIVDWLEALDGHELVAEWLEQRGAGLSAARRAFLSGNAPTNAAKRNMIDLTPNQGSATARVGAWVAEHMGGWPELMTAEDVKQEIAQALKSGVSDMGQDTRLVPSTRQLGAILAGLGWVKVGKGNVIPMPPERGSGRRYVWATRDAAKWETRGKGEVAKGYAEGWGFQAPKGIEHGSADGSNVVMLGTAGAVTKPVTKPVSQDTAQSEQAEGAGPGTASGGDFPF